MAYMTQWRLDIKDINEIRCLALEEKEINEYIEENEDMRWVFGEGLFEWGEDNRSFFNKDENMYKISKHFHDIVFVLKYDPIVGKDEGMYIEYWFDGEVQKEVAAIAIPKFEINKLTYVGY